MRTIKILLLLVCVLFVGGCWTLSLQPFYTEETITFKPELIGAWGDSTNQKNSTWIFEQGENRNYHLTTKEQGKPDGVFEVHLMQWGERLFMDIFPADDQQLDQLYQSHLIPAHTVWRLAFRDQAIIISPLNRDWLEERLQDSTLTLAHIREDNVIILTAPTEELQAFLIAYPTVAFEDDPFVLYHKNW